LQTFLMC
jgi:hypothetical protein